MLCHLLNAILATCPLNTPYQHTYAQVDYREFTIVTVSCHHHPPPHQHHHHQHLQRKPKKTKSSAAIATAMAANFLQVPIVSMSMTMSMWMWMILTSWPWLLPSGKPLTPIHLIYSRGIPCINIAHECSTHDTDLTLALTLALVLALHCTILHLITFD